MARYVQVQAGKQAQRRKRAERDAEPVTEWLLPRAREADGTDGVIERIDACLAELGDR